MAEKVPPGVAQFFFFHVRSYSVRTRIRAGRIEMALFAHTAENPLEIVSHESIPVVCVAKQTLLIIYLHNSAIIQTKVVNKVPLKYEDGKNKVVSALAVKKIMLIKERKKGKRHRLLNNTLRRKRFFS